MCSKVVTTSINGLRTMICFKNILDFQDNDNSLISLVYSGEELTAVIETWDNKKYRIVFYNFGKLELNSGISFEIGSVFIKQGTEFNTPWEEDFKRENIDHADYSELIIYDPWQTDRINLRVIYEKMTISQIIDNGKN